MDKISLNYLINKEKEQLRQRRKKLNMEHGTPDQENWFGIALSGGGIRSATINMGILKTLNKFGIVQQADYMSSVSGGGYTHSYVQGTVKKEGSFDKLFTDEQIGAMRQHGEYLTPRKGLGKLGNTLLLTIAFVVSWAMSMVGPLIIGGILYYLYLIIIGLLGTMPFEWINFYPANEVIWWIMMIAGGMLIVHFIVNIVFNFSLRVSKDFNYIELGMTALLLTVYAWVAVGGFKGGDRISSGQILDYAINMVLLFLIGFFTNPNALSFHRFYRKQLADLFLSFARNNFDNIALKDIFNANSEKKEDYIAPYPIINTCLNLLNPDGDEVFKGTKTSDYFLLSPLYCGSKLVGYVPTNRYVDYQQMTLPAAVTISAAAVNPGMGMYSNKMLSVLMTMFNARLGFWISNPRKLISTRAIVWWPIYFFRELLGRIGSSNKMINISDGGHIENLGVYELLRRKCRLIIAVDAGEDKKYDFPDLSNMLIRARNELGIEIRFRMDEQPEDLIRPKPTQIYSQKRYAIADIYQWWEDKKVIDPVTQKEKSNIVNYAEPKKVGTFVYLKSSVLAPKGKPVLSEDGSELERLKYGTYKYKIYHPDFPHESTADQFFDEIQWEAYYQLGQFIGADVLGIEDLTMYEEACGSHISVEELINWFDNKQDLFAGKVAMSLKPPSAEVELESTKKRDGVPVVQEEVRYQM
ncbi:MAG: hypothetical protein H6576_12045 [Lewinellaceae bacterium]|nr:hypothetical protein [Saprospiraceae bacterium]MCB9344423.1 hypothetical protein [Lewinellaceae bacterium]